MILLFLLCENIVQQFAKKITKTKANKTIGEL